MRKLTRKLGDGPLPTLGLVLLPITQGGGFPSAFPLKHECPLRKVCKIRLVV